MTAEFERLCPSNLLEPAELASLGCELQRARDLAERLGCSAEIERIDERERTRFGVQLCVEQRDRSAPPPGGNSVSRAFEDGGFEVDDVHYDSLHKRYRVQLTLGLAVHGDTREANSVHNLGSESSDDDSISTSEPTRKSRRLREQKPEFDSSTLDRVLRHEPTTARALGLARAHRVPANVRLHAARRRRAHPAQQRGPRRVIAKKPLKRTTPALKAAADVGSKASWLRWAASKVTLGLIGVDPSYAAEREVYEREIATSYADYPDIFAPPVVM